jgi:hypothetical protein
MRRRGNKSAGSMTRLAAENKAKEEQRRSKYAVFKAIDDAYRKGDLDALLLALGDPAGFPNSLHFWGLGLGDFPLSTRFIGARLHSSKRFSPTEQIPTIQIGLDFLH